MPLITEAFMMVSSMMLVFLLVGVFVCAILWAACGLLEEERASSAIDNPPRS